MINGATARILNCFLNTNVLSFSDLCEQAGYPTDLGGYYIRRLIAAKCLIKTARGQYEITPTGKQQLIVFANHEGQLVISHPRVCVLVVATSNGKYVVMRRKRQPYIGFAEWPATTVKVGEDLTEAAKRVINLRFEAEGEPQFVGFFRRVDLYEDSVFDDKLFAVHTCELPSTTPPVESSEVGDNLLLGSNELAAIEKPARALHDVFRFTQDPSTYIEKRYDLSLDDIAASE